MIMVEHVARIRKKRINFIQDCGGKKLKETAHLEDLGVDYRIILKCILHTQNGILWTRFIAQDRRVVVGKN
jgi:hypothetical protein